MKATTDDDGAYMIRFIDLPPAIEAATCVDLNGFANVYINARLSFEARRRAIKHEMRHIRRDDTYSDSNIREVEQK